MDSQARFSKTTVALHWIIVSTMIGSLVYGLFLEERPRSPAISRRRSSYLLPFSV